MTRKIAVAIVHGIGRPEPEFADGIMARLAERFRAATGADGLVLKPVFWAPVLQDAENELWKRLGRGGPMDFVKLRRFMVDFAADAIAYQPQPGEKDIYEAVHKVVAGALRALAGEAGADAPLCFIAHSLGSVIASNYIYDLQTHPKRKIIPVSVRKAMGDSPLERGETLAGFYTLGSPIALWSLRYADFGRPVQVPSPSLNKLYPKAGGEWVNFYDQDDVIGYPLKSVNKAYGAAVKEDRAVNVGGLLSSWNPTSHTEYWADRDVIHPIADSLARLWRQIS
jgi:hypothetical protein